MITPMSSGGGLTPVERRGDTVRRARGDWTPTVHALLRHLQTVGFGAAPRVLALEDDVEVLAFVPGRRTDRHRRRGWSV